LEATLLARLAASTAMAKQSESEIPVSVECASSAAYLVPTVLAKIQTRAQQILSDLSTSNYTRDMVDIVGPGLNQMIQKCEQLKTQNQSVAMAQMLISEANARPLLESAAPYGIEDAASYATCCGSLPEETRLQCLEQAVEWWETEQQNLGTLTWAFYDNCQHMKDYETHYDNMCQPPVVYQQVYVSQNIF
jgi:uncharacterized protein YbaP (TraB family)